MKCMNRQNSSRLLCCLLAGILCVSLLMCGMPVSAEPETEAVDFSYFTQGPSISFHDLFDFERGYVNWKDVTVDGEHVLQITKGPLYTLKDMPKRYTLSFMARSTETYPSIKMTAGFKRDDAAETVVQIDGAANDVILISDSEAFSKGKAYKNSGYAEGQRDGIYLEYPGWLNQNEWYGVTLCAVDDLLHIFINGEFIYTIEDEDGFDGCFVLRSNNNKALQLKNLKYTAEATETVYSGNQVAGVVDHSGLVLPGKTETFTYTPKQAGDVSVKVADATGTVYESGNMQEEDGTYKYAFIPRGKAGCQTVTFTQNGEVATFRFYLQHITEVITGDEQFDFFYNMMQNQLLTWPEGQVYNLSDGDRVRQSVGWIRDDTFTLEGSKYLISTSASWIDFYLSQQRKDGMLYEKIEPNQTPQTYYFYLPSDCYKYVEENIGGVTRLDIEADVEFLFIQAAYETWQATGDHAWMKEILPGLDKALTYIRTDKTRWSSEYGLAIRANTIDTWDYYYTNEHRAVSPWWEPKPGFSKTAMCVFYGDNTGFYQAACQLAEMYRVTGNKSRMNYWLKEAANVRENLMKTAWNGNYFAHMVHIDPKPDDEMDSIFMKEDFKKDWDRLSLSLTYSLNRGFFTQEEGQRVIESFRDFRDNPPAIESGVGTETDERYFSEWVTIYPAYLDGFGGAKSVGTGMNACLCSFGAGALSKGSYLYGYADYGTNILERLKDLCVRDGQIYFVYYRNGEVLPGVGPATWSSGSIYAALTEGLVGVRDGGNQYRYAAIAPAWTSTAYDQVYTTTSYGASDTYVAYTATHDRDAKTSRYTLVGDGETVNLQLLVPSGNIPKTVSINGEVVSFNMKAAADDVWAFVRMEQCSNTKIYEIEVTYEQGEPPASAFSYQIPPLGEMDPIKDASGSGSGLGLSNQAMLYIIVALIAVVVVFVVGTTVIIVVKKR